MDELRVSSWGELNEMLYEGSWQPDIRRHRATYAYRGMSDAGHDLSHTLSRLGKESARLEGHILRNFRKYAPRESVPGDSVWNWLAVGQQHGLPTRLLDWTYSPYVALHFATQDLEAFDRDGLVWCLDYAAANEYLPSRLREILRQEGSDTFTAEMLACVARTVRELEQLAEEPFLLSLEPPSVDDRIVNQFALFSLISDPTVSHDRWIGEHPRLVRKIAIPASLKWEIRDKLDQANITERVLYPGLDGLGRWLARYYTPRT
jgi:hypothetical protein